MMYVRSTPVETLVNPLFHHRQSAHIPFHRYLSLHSTRAHSKLLSPHVTTHNQPPLLPQHIILSLGIEPAGNLYVAITTRNKSDRSECCLVGLARMAECLDCGRLDTVVSSPAVATSRFLLRIFTLVHHSKTHLV